MIEKKFTLTKDDVQRLIADPTAANRADTASKVAAEFDQQTLNEDERKIAEDIIRVLVKDMEVRVREALSAQLKSCPDLPHDIAVTLASDVESVALPVLKYSEVLSEQDLLAIVAENSSAKQSAIAQREGVTAKVADALIDTGNETVVAKLVANETAELNDWSLNRVMDNFRDSEVISDSMARRPQLPPGVSDRLMAAIAARMQEVLAGNRDLPADKITNILLQAREQAMTSLLDRGSSDVQLERLVDRLNRESRLTPWLILRNLCMGDVTFFEMSLAKLADVPLENARMLIHDRGQLGLQSLVSKGGIPDRLYPAFRAAVDVASETDYDGGANDRQRYVERMIERVLTQYGESDVEMDDGDVSYLIEKLNQLAA